MSGLIKIKTIAVSAAKKAGRELIKRYNSFDRSTIKLKTHHEILTQADLASEKIILKEIRKYFPSHHILSEEAGKISLPLAKGEDGRGWHFSPRPTSPLSLAGRGSESDFLWIIDPLDGTTNFSMHNPIWCVSIAVVVETRRDASLHGEECSRDEALPRLYRDKIALGVIYAPLLEELYIAERGKGARMNGKKIKVSASAKKALHTFCHGRSQKEVKRALRYYSRQKLRELDCRQLGSAALELAFVASGRTESIVIPGVNSWDVAAGVLLVREAGGRVTDFKGKEWNLKSKDMLATNGRLHKQVLRVVSKI